MRRAKVSVAQAVEHNGQVYPSVNGGDIQDTKGAKDFYVERTSRCRAIAFVHKEQGGLLFCRKGNRVSFAGVQMHEGGAGWGAQRHDVEP